MTVQLRRHVKEQETVIVSVLHNAHVYCPVQLCRRVHWTAECRV